MYNETVRHTGSISVGIENRATPIIIINVSHRSYLAVNAVIGMIRLASIPCMTHRVVWQCFACFCKIENKIGIFSGFVILERIL